MWNIKMYLCKLSFNIYTRTFIFFWQEIDQIHIFSGGSLWSALHSVCIPACGSEQLGV